MTGPPPSYIPPPPPPPPPESWAPAKPTSGKAIAAMVCGLAGPLCALFCPPLGVAVIVGLIMGTLAIIETGKNGSRAGRGLAIAGTVLSALGIVATIAAFVGFMVLMRAGEEQQEENLAERMYADQDLLTMRLKQYCQENNGSLGPGGPILAKGVARQDNRPVESTADGKVHGTLQIDHLAGPDELKLSRRHGGTGWELVVTGQLTATLRARRWDGEILLELEVRDAARGLWVRTGP
ncbi:MAG: DUF4190 domain-containing protein [Planctomycetes bacterium]|nr:DUF4190 domain-containing protein [Planctomycetota bacterium]